MTPIIDNNMAHEIAKDEAKKQLKCDHQFESRHIELLDEDISICAKCDIDQKTFLLIGSMPCFGKYRWYRLACWECPLSMLCQAKKEKSI